MLTKNKELGNVGENIARAFLLKQGFTILGSNFYTKFGEIDIICSRFNKDGVEEMFFVEVKTRSDINKKIYPEDAINSVKKIRMEKAVQIYLEKNKINKIFYSFSCVAIVFNKGRVIDIKFFEKI